MSVTVRWLIVSLCVAAALTSCGKKGPLYLPQEPPGASATHPAPAPAENPK